MSFLLVSAPQCVLSGGFGHRARMALALERPQTAVGVCRAGSYMQLWIGFRTALGVWRDKCAHFCLEQREATREGARVSLTISKGINHWKRQFVV